MAEPAAPRDAATGRAGLADLSAFSVLLTAARRADDLSAWFTRRGATVRHAPAGRAVAAPAGPLLEATRRLVDRPPDVVVVTSAEGLRTWTGTASAHGLDGDLHRVLAASRIVARGARARAAVRAAGFVEAGTATSGTTAEVVELLLADGVDGRRVAVQLPALPDPAVLARLADAGADVETVPAVVWSPAADPAAALRAVDAVCAGTVDAVVFTSPAGSRAFVDAARTAGRLDDVHRALRHDVVPAAVGPVTAEPLAASGLRPLVPDRPRLAALVRTVAGVLEATGREIPTPAGVLRVRGQTVTLDGAPLPLSPVPRALLRVLARTPGEVVDRGRLLATMPGAHDLHAVEVAVARLRTGIGRPGVVETVVKRGYRLAVRNG